MTKRRRLDSSMGLSFDDPAVAGPLIGVGTAKVGAIAARVVFKDADIAKFSDLTGAGLGALIGWLLSRTPRMRASGQIAMWTAITVGALDQIEKMLTEAGLLKDGYLGVITPEQFQGLGAYDDYGNMFGQTSPVQLLDSGGGGSLGVHVPEQFEGMGNDEYNSMMGAGPGDVELLGGFGSNWMS